MAPMEPFTPHRLSRIERRFCEKAGLPYTPRRRRPVRTLTVLAAALCLLSLTVFAAGLFSPLHGDALSLSAQYEGDGIVSVTVENGSDKPLAFQPQLKLMRWSTAQEVEPLPGGEVVFADLRFAPRSEGVMTLDLSGAYDVAALEKPLQDDHYYLLLTNQNFLFGQDWICSLFFSDTGEEPPAPVEPLLPDQALTARRRLCCGPSWKIPHWTPSCGGRTPRTTGRPAGR